MSSSAKLSGTSPVSATTTTTLVKLSGTKLVTTTSSHVQAASVSTDAGTMTDHHLPYAPEQVNYFPFEEEQEEKPTVQPGLQAEPFVLFDDTVTFDAMLTMSRHEALQSIGTYENNMETTNIMIKKSTKAFG